MVMACLRVEVCSTVATIGVVRVAGNGSNPDLRDDRANRAIIMRFWG
jgi:hypothetical protein